MYLVAIITWLLIQLSLALPLMPLTASDIITGINQLEGDIAILQSTLKSFKANDLLSAFTALKIQRNTKAIEDDLRSLITITSGTDDLSGDDSGTVATAVVNLPPQIKDLLNNIVEKKPAFASAILLIGDLSKTVEQSLTSQKQLSQQFGDILIPKPAEPYKDYAPLITNQISGYFDTAITAYQGCTGLI